MALPSRRALARERTMFEVTKIFGPVGRGFHSCVFRARDHGLALPKA
jgi:hypothetical protein